MWSPIRRVAGLFTVPMVMLPACGSGGRTQPLDELVDRAGDRLREIEEPAEDQQGGVGGTVPPDQTGAGEVDLRPPG